MTDQELQRLLSKLLTPPPLGDDAAIESTLATQPADPAYGQGMLARAGQPAKKTNKYLAIAALLFLAVIPFAIFAIANLSPADDPNTAGRQGEESEQLVEIAPEFPEPTFHGTPLDIRLPNLEPARSPRLHFTAPASVHLISRDAMVTASDPQPLIGGLAMITDGNKTGDDEHFVELSPGHQWVQIDLGQSHEIFAVTLWHYHQRMRAYRDIVIETSQDPSFSSSTATIFNNDHDNSLGLGAGDDPAYIETHHGRIIDFDALTARYIRLHSNGNTTDELNHYTEVEVYGHEL
jgi:hypothetical protein